jgi:sugar phosphate isomerase/epimerase
MLSITTDYAKDTGDPSPYLRRIADAGFSYIHWCHQWNTDFLYSRWEIEQIQKWLEEYGLQLLDLHGSAGNEKNWGSSQEYQRLAGLELVRNRIEMTAHLSADVVIMHVPGDPDSIPVRKSLDALEPFARERNVRIAIENGNFEAIRKLLSEYDSGYVGLCYDSGHGNVSADGLDHLESIKDRLISVHLHDNDGTSDQHKLLFSGTVDWERLARIMAGSAYTKCVSMEVTMARTGIEDEGLFLAEAFETGTRFSRMIEEEKRMGGYTAFHKGGKT